MADVEKPVKAKRNLPKSARKKSEEEVLIGKGQGKDPFNKILQQAVDQSNSDVRESKKKKKKTEEFMLEKLRKGEGLRKDSEDPALLNNIYDPDDGPKNEKSNKRRQQELDRKKNKDFKDNLGSDKKKTKNADKGEINKAYDEENETPEKTKAGKKKAKKADTKEKEEVIPDEPRAKPRKKKDRKDRSLSPPPSPEKEAPEDKKKTKKKKKKEETDTSESESGDQLEVPPEEERKPKGKKKDKKKKGAARATIEEGATAAEEPAPPEPKPVVEDQGRILGITVHRTDKLKTDFYMSHPLVRIHLVDAETGMNVKKQSRDRAVTSYYESQNENVDFVLPIMTQPFDFKQQKSTLPVWEEQIFFNENFHYLITEDPKVIVFFELLDFVSMNATRQNYNMGRQDGGWHRIAWAFLKLLGGNGVPNADRKIRLQLYQPPMRYRPKPDQVEVFQWWQNTLRLAYPSTLYVTIKGIIPTDKVEPSTRSMFATQQEKGGRTFEDLQRTLDHTSAREGTRRRDAPTAWTRLPGQLCKVPNEVHLVMAGGRNGCSLLQFSHDGRFLACGCKETDGYPIFVYEIPSGKARGQLVGHYGLVYDLCWSKDNKHILSASSDGTARVWDAETLSSREVKMLPHPGYVYTARYHPKVQKIVATGGFDQILRVWSLQDAGKHAQLMQELDGHLSHINTLVFDDEGTKMYSGDGLGQLRVWNVFVTDKASKRGMLKDWSFHSELKDKDFKGVAINHLQLHPGGKKLMVHTRDNIIRMMDLRVNHVMQRYHGALNYKEKLTSTLTPCGTFVISGSEDSNLYIWNAESSDQVAMFADLRYQKPITCVIFHPHDHMMAMCALGDNEPILVYRFNHKAAFLEAERAAVITRTGRPGAPVVWHSTTEGEEDSEMETTRAKLSSTTDNVRANELARMDRITKKLEAVAPFTQPISSILPSEHPLGVPSPRPGASGTYSTWGSTFDPAAVYGAQLSDSMNMALSALGAHRNTPPPGMMSPHATSNLLATAQQQQQFAAQADYMKQSQSGWRPSFTVVGQSGMRSVSPMMGRHTPQATLNTSQGIPQFTFQGVVNQVLGEPFPGGALSQPFPGGPVPYSVTARPPLFHTGVMQPYSLYTGPPPSAGPVLLDPTALQGQILTPPLLPWQKAAMAQQATNMQEQVIAMYDYQGQRSDEITMAKGDVIKVLYKENNSWWLGEHQSGQQGFFPVSYVTPLDGDKDSMNGLDISPGSVSEDDIDTRRKTAAVVTKGGSLKFLSGTEDSDVESSPKKTKKKVRHKTASVTIEKESLPPSHRRRRRSSSKPAASESEA